MERFDNEKIFQNPFLIFYLFIGTWKGTPVAVKILSNICQQDILPDQLVVSFEEEVALLSRLRHPNICLFLGVCLDSPHRAIVTELVARGSLWDVLRTPGIFNVTNVTLNLNFL